jgi:hypothetical protein
VIDTRELILARILVVSAGLEGVLTAWRNRSQISDLKRPAVIILDADEQADPSDPSPRHASAIRRVIMNPQVFLLLSDKAVDVGTSLNAFRANYVKAIMEDQTLIDLTLDGIGMRYDGCSSGFARGRSMEGEMIVNIAFTYLWRVSDL